MMQRYANRSKFASSRTSSSEDDTVHPRPPYPGKSQKSRTTSGEKGQNRGQDISSLENIGNVNTEERPRSSGSNKLYAKTKSRTVSKERPDTQKEGKSSISDINRRRSRTSSNEQAQQIEREDMLDPEEVAYEMMKKDHHPRRFRDEAAMDLEDQEASGREHRPFYDRNQLDEEDVDEYDNRYQMTEDEDEEPPPTEPIFDYNNAEITNA